MTTVFVSSKNGTGQSNSYTVHLTHRLKNITQVDLVAASVPNTMYNVTTGMINGTFIEPGFYNASDLATAINATLIQSQGKFQFSNVISSLSPDMMSCLGVTSFPTSKSQTLINLTPNAFIFLDIDELKTTSTIDTKSLVAGSDTYDGTSVSTTFGMIPIGDTLSGYVKMFKEGSDYKHSILFKSGLTLDRLTVRWVDSNGHLLNFNGNLENSFILRIHTTEPREDPPQVQNQPPQPREDPPQIPHPKRWGRWVALIAILVFLGVVYYQRKPTCSFLKT
jgi:hypothetical protein